MKKLVLIPAIALSGLFFNTADAQIRIHFGFGYHPGPVVYQPAPVLGEQPVYDQQDYNQTPAFNSDADDYYYLPDVGAYYDVTDQCYVYFNGDNWISAEFLPGAYANYDWRICRRFEVREARPFMRDDFYRERYNGQRIAEWSTHYNGRYANQGYRSDDRREHEQGYRGNDDQGNRGQGYRGADDHGNANQGNRGGDKHGYTNQGNHPQPQMPNGGFNRPAQPYRPGNQHFDSYGQGGFKPQTPPNHNNGQRNDNHGAKPADQNHAREQRGGDDHLAQYRPQNNAANRRMSRL